MSWSVGFDEKWQRDVGYGVPAICDHPECSREIDRGLAHVCGGEPFGGDEGCGLYFCDEHLFVFVKGREHQVCLRCRDAAEPFTPKPDVAEWVEWKLTDESWAGWRAENPAAVEALRNAAVEGR